MICSDFKTITDVLIVGAGPSGLTIACQLASYGIRFRIIDKKDQPANYSGALIIQARSLEIFQQMGIAPKMMKEGSSIHSIRLVFNGKKPLRIPINHIGKNMTPFPSLLMLEQSRTEQLLTEHLRQKGYVVERNTELLSFMCHNQDVISTLLNREGREETIQTSYLIAADGGHSLIRKRLGIPFTGITDNTRLLVADCTAQLELPPREVCFSFSEQAVAGFFPLKNGNWRIDSVVPRQLKTSRDVTFDDMATDFSYKTRINLQMLHASWFSVFQTNLRYANPFHINRCFLIGDSAHVCSPIGAQGMNTGIQDANNLSWKIAMVIRGQANAKLLDSYSEERVPVAKKIIRATFLPLRIITSQHFILRNLRVYLLPKLAKLVLPLLNYPVITQLLFKGISQIGYSYRMTNRSTQFFSQKFYKPAPKPGDRLPFVLFKETGETSNIQDKVTETCFCLLIFSKNPKSLIDMDRFVKKYKKILTVETIQYNLGTALLYKRFGIKREGYFIVRPDLHIAIRSSTVNIESFETALRIVRCM